MAIAQMKKFVIASHRSEASELLESLQQAGIAQILDAERAMVSKEWPELQVKAERPKELEDMVARLDKSIQFLEENATEKSPKTIFEPLIAVKAENYSEITSGSESLELLEVAELTAENIDTLLTEQENEVGHLDMLLPWAGLSTPVEELGSLETASCHSGLIPTQNIEAARESLGEFTAIMETVGETGGLTACMFVCMAEESLQVQKALRGCDFEPVNFEGLQGTVDELITASKAKLDEIASKLAEEKQIAAETASGLVKLQMLFDHNNNLLDREQAGASCPATENTVLFEGWVRTRDFSKLEKIVGGYSCSSLDELEIGEEEIPPVEIDNGPAVRPFETITRLYGMPNPKDVDPTVFLAPFFALFFGLCLTDAAYGLILCGLLGWSLKKLKGDKGVLWMFLGCSVVTVVAGALTGGWFGDAITTLVGEESALENLRLKMMLFDPMQDPMPFFIISLGLVYVQIIFGLFIAFFNNLKNKDYMTAIFENLTWIIFFNSIGLLAVSKALNLPEFVGTIAVGLIILQAVLIFLFTERNSGLAGRIGGGAYALFSAVFYFGDLLSYVRIMALGMVTAGLGMAVNILVKLMMDIPYVGYILAAILFIGGHVVNLLLSVLSSFVHSLRLQFVEFFPKFLQGGGIDFKPLRKNYQHVAVEETVSEE